MEQKIQNKKKIQILNGPIMIRIYRNLKSCKPRNPIENLTSEKKILLAF